MERLRTSLKTLTNQLEVSRDRVQSLERTNETLQDEYTSCLTRNTKLLADLKQKEAQWETRCSELTRQGSNHTHNNNNKNTPNNNNNSNKKPPAIINRSFILNAIQNRRRQSKASSAENKFNFVVFVLLSSLALNFLYVNLI